MKLPFAALATLALAACSAEPGASTDNIVVVRSDAPAAATDPAPTDAAVPAPRPTAPVRQLSVEESARINTSEMWSEPIKE